MINFGKKGAWARIQGLPNFLGTPYYLRNGKSYGFQIWPVYSERPCEQKPIKNFREKGAWAYRWTAQFFRVPLLSQERVKLRTSNLAGTFRGSIRIKAHEKFWRKGSVGVSRDCPMFWVPLLSQERAKLWTSNLAGTFTVSIRTKAR